MKALRPYQLDCVTQLRRSLASRHRRPVAKLPTGGGKTLLAAAIINMAREKNPNAKALFIVDAITLVDQTVEHFALEGIDDIGVIQASHELTDFSQPIQIASVQTLQRRAMPKADIVFVDECHRMNRWLHTIMASPEWKDVPFIGLSATPWAKGMGKIYDDLIIPVTIDDLIEQGYLCPFRMFAAAHPDLTGVRTEKGDYVTAQLSKAMDEGNLIADLVTTWQAKGEDRPSLVFCVDRAHAAKVQARFEAAGIGCGYIDMHTPSAERHRIKAQLDRGEIKVVCNVACLTTGVDWSIGCIVLARPTKSEMLYVQMVGRGLRVNPGIPDCIILDHSDNALRLGFVTDIVHTELDMGEKRVSEPKPKEALPKECPKCTFLRPAKVHECPACGFAPVVQSKISEVDGELVEIKRKKRINGEVSWEQKIKFIGELKTHAILTGKSEGWIAHKYREALGVWPNDPRLKAAPPVECSQRTKDWIKSRNIAFAKRIAAINGGRHGAAA